MPSYSLRKQPDDPNEHTRTFLWDVLLDESTIDREEHDRRSLAFSYIVARDLLGFSESEDRFRAYLAEARTKETPLGQPQTMPDRCALAYYYCWLLPMLDEQLRQGMQAVYESELKTADEQLDYSIALVKPVLVNYWRHKNLANIEKKCSQRVSAIVEGIPNSIPSEIDWNTMSQLGRDRLIIYTDRIRRKLEKNNEWMRSASGSFDDIMSGKARKRKRQSEPITMEAIKTEVQEMQGTAGPASTVAPAADTQTEGQPQGQPQPQPEQTGTAVEGVADTGDSENPDQNKRIKLSM